MQEAGNARLLCFCRAEASRRTALSSVPELAPEAVNRYTPYASGAAGGLWSGCRHGNRA